MSRSVPRWQPLAVRLLLLALVGTAPSRAADDDKKPATVVVHLPKGASLVIGGMESKQTGPDRNFDTPDLPPGQTFSYQLQAAWTENGKEVKRELKLVVLAGETTEVDLNTYTGAGPVRPKASKLPEPTPAADLRLAIPDDVEMKAGGEIEIKLMLEAANLKEPVRVTFPDLPPGVTIKEQTVKPAPGQAMTPVVCRVVAGDKAAAGKHRVRVVAVAGDVKVEGELTLAVRKADAPPPPKAAALQVQAPPVTEVEAGGKADLSVKVKRTNYDGPVTVTVTGLPKGVTAAEQVIPAGNMTEATVPLAAARDAPAGTAEAAVEARGGDPRAAVKCRVVVKAAKAAPAPAEGSLELEFPIAQVTLQPGGGKKLVQVRLNRKGFEGPVALKFVKVPAGVTLREVTVPADRKQFYFEAAAGADAREGETEIKVVGVADRVRAETPFKVIVKK
jgi:uncharacterized protein (TIGR03000 family)